MCRQRSRGFKTAASYPSMPRPPGEVIDDALAIACGDGAIRPVTIQPAGKPAMAAADYLRGKPVARGTRLS